MPRGEPLSQAGSRNEDNPLCHGHTQSPLPWPSHLYHLGGQGGTDPIHGDPLGGCCFFKGKWCRRPLYKLGDNPVKSTQPRGRSARGQAHQPVWGRPVCGWKAGLWQFSELYSLPDQASREVLTCRSTFYFSALFIYTTYRAPRRLVNI